MEDLTDKEIADEIIKRNPSDYKGLIATVVERVFSHYTGKQLDEIGLGFTANGLNTTDVCRDKHPGY